MGTRSITHIDDSNGTTLVSLYRQFDGYPEGMGLELARFLDGMKIVNGIPFEREGRKLANGMPCLAAQIIAHFKTEIGFFYIVGPEEKQIYNYVVYLDGNYWTAPQETAIKIRCVSGEQKVFDGTPAEWIKQFGGDKNG